MSLDKLAAKKCYEYGMNVILYCIWIIHYIITFQQIKRPDLSEKSPFEESVQYRKRYKEVLAGGGMESHVSYAHITEINTQKTSSEKRKMKTGI